MHDPSFRANVVHRGEIGLHERFEMFLLVNVAEWSCRKAAIIVRVESGTNTVSSERPPRLRRCVHDSRRLVKVLVRWISFDPILGPLQPAFRIGRSSSSRWTRYRRRGYDERERQDVRQDKEPHCQVGGMLNETVTVSESCGYESAMKSKGSSYQ